MNDYGAKTARPLYPTPPNAVNVPKLITLQVRVDGVASGTADILQRLHALSNRLGINVEDHPEPPQPSQPSQPSLGQSISASVEVAESHMRECFHILNTLAERL